ncbi:hypothetical protein C4A74_03283 [Escherichia coli]|nr:hypothetical protein C4A74_03283 [Escherichia coli]
MALGGILMKTRIILTPVIQLVLGKTQPHSFIKNLHILMGEI